MLALASVSPVMCRTTIIARELSCTAFCFSFPAVYVFHSLLSIDWYQDNCATTIRSRCAAPNPTPIRRRHTPCRSGHARGRAGFNSSQECGPQWRA
jgi:hypothetical protein